MESRADGPRENASEWPLLLMILLIGAFRFVSLGFKDLQAWDEALYAVRSIVIVQHGAWLDQTRWAIDGLYSSLPPPFVIWITALSFLLFGISEFAARFGSALFGALTLFVIYGIGKRLRSKSVGFLAALLFGLNPFVTFYARQGQLDTTLTFFLALAAYFILSALQQDDRWKAVLVGLSLGGALMTKLFVGFGIPLALVALLPLVGRQERASLARLTWVSLSVALVVALPWHVFMTVAHGDGNPMFFLTQSQLFERAVSGIEGNVKPLGIFYFVNQLLILFPVGIAWFVLGMVRAGRARERDWLLIALWFAVFFVVFSLMRTKLPVYTLPMLVPASLIAAGAMDDAFTGETSARSFRLLLGATGLAILWSASQLWRDLAKQLLSGLFHLNLPSQRILPGLLPPLVIALFIMAVVWTLKSETLFAFAKKHFREGLVILTALPTLYHVSISDRFAYRDGATELAALVSARSYASIVVAGYERNPQLTYYLGGSDIGWRHDINVRRIIPPKDAEAYRSWLVTELATESPRTLVVFEKDKFIRYLFVNPAAFVPPSLRLVFRSRRYDAYEIIAFPDFVRNDAAPSLEWMPARPRIAVTRSNVEPHRNAPYVAADLR